MSITDYTLVMFCRLPFYCTIIILEVLTMKMNRLIGILTLLLQKEKVTATQLAERFEVSKRTILRDIDDLSIAGMPIITLPGYHGGIQIADGFKIDKTYFNATDLQAIFAGLQSLNSISSHNQYDQIIDKFLPDKNRLVESNHLLIDLASHYKDSLSSKIKLLEEAIESTLSITFTYYSKQGEVTITFNPYLIIYQWSNWYVLGYNHPSQQFELLKLNRIWNLSLLDDVFILQDIPHELLESSSYFPSNYEVKILFDPSVKWRIVEEYGLDCFTTQPNGKVLFKFPFTNKDYLFSWILGFGNLAELLEPQELRNELKDILLKTLPLYNEGDK